MYLKVEVDCPLLTTFDMRRLYYCATSILRSSVLADGLVLVSSHRGRRYNIHRLRDFFHLTRNP